MQYLYDEIYKMLPRAYQEDINNRKTISCPWFGRLNIVKLAIDPKLIYTSIIITIKVLAASFVQIC